MKISRVIVPVLLAAALALSWTVYMGNAFRTWAVYGDHIEMARESLENGLYEQAIEHYKSALTQNKSQSVYLKIKEAYDLFYAEEESSFVRGSYLTDMEAAAADYPACADFWVAQAHLYLDASDYTKAYSTVRRAKQYGAGGEELNGIYQQLLYMTKLDFKLYYDFRTALNGYLAVSDGDQWKVLNARGESLTGGYKLIGLINDDGKGIFVNEIDTRLLDAEQVTRARFDFDIEDAGYFTESSGYIPVKIDGKWKYTNLDGEFLPGAYESAGSFYNHKAAVRKDGRWYLIDEQGKKASDDTYEDIKLDLYGCYLQSGVIIAKENGRYRLYDENFKQKGDFSCDDIDICIGGGPIAFRQGEKWGYADLDGNIVAQPAFASAKSFSNGFAAVESEQGLWGFVDDTFTLVIDYAYLDAHYFSGEETCMVSTTKNAYQILHFMFE